jgi:hypothetical protein
MITAPKRYIGNGVYVEFTAGMLKLTTEDGIETTNTIYMEHQTYQALVAYVEWLKKKSENNSCVNQGA